MGIKVEPAKLLNYLTMLSLPKGGKCVFDPLLLNFTNNGLVVMQTDTARVMGIVGMIGKKGFEEYEAINEKLISPVNIIKILKNSFKTDRVIELLFDEENINLIGKSEIYREKMVNVEVNKLETNSIIATQYGAIPAKLKVDKCFKFDASYLNVNAEEIRFEYSKNLKLIIETEVSRYEKTLTTAEGFENGSGSIAIFGEYIDNVVKALSGTIYLIFTKPKEGDAPTPIVISQKRDIYSINYIIAPKV